MRQLRVLIEGLPVTSAYGREIHGPWSDLEHLLATVADRVEVGNYLQAKIAGGKPRKPKPLKRPGEKQETRIGDRGDRSSAEAVQYLRGFLPGGAAPTTRALSGAPGQIEAAPADPPATVTTTDLEPVEVYEANSIGLDDDGAMFDRIPEPPEPSTPDTGETQ